MTAPDDQSVDAAPFLRVVRGRPTDAELAALVVALRSRGGDGAQQPSPPSPWGDPARRLRSWGRPGSGR